MWLMVLFDLPVTSSKERKAAQTFRKFLLNNGFEMSQFSVYFRFCGTKEKTEPYITRIKNNSHDYCISTKHSTYTAKNRYINSNL